MKVSTVPTVAGGSAASTGTAADTPSTGLTADWYVADGEEMCPYRLLLEHITSRWGVLVLLRLAERPHRFNEMRRSIGRVSEKMLAQTLRTLERDGLVHRDAQPVIPPRVDYSLTDLGREAAQHVRSLAEWTELRMADVERARRSHDTAKEQR